MITTGSIHAIAVLPIAAHLDGMIFTEQDRLLMPLTVAGLAIAGASILVHGLVRQRRSAQIERADDPTPKSGK